MINYKSTSSKFNPLIPAKHLRPKCLHEGCTEPKVIAGLTHATGKILYNRYCREHGNQVYYNGKSAMHATAQTLGLTPTQYVERARLLRGFDTDREYRNYLAARPVINLPTLAEAKLKAIRARAKNNAN